MNIVTIGGGSGTPVLNEALLLVGVKKITSIVTVMDSGGITGRMRTDAMGKEVAYRKIFQES
ncbi:MAG: 2-phospho-L-lactate transferase CofD family protein [Patescibacteria group bacterium]